MQKIILIGSPGSGKSTMARKLEKDLDIEIYHLDNLFWKPGWTPVPFEEQVTITEELVKKESWMIDGNYGGTLSIRLKAADTVVLFDLPRWLCMYQVFKRLFQYWGKQRPDINAGKERLNVEFLKYVWRFRREKRPKIIQQLENVDTSKKKVYVIHSRKEAEEVYRQIVSKKKPVNTLG